MSSFLYRWRLLCALLIFLVVSGEGQQPVSSPVQREAEAGALVREATELRKSGGSAGRARAIQLLRRAAASFQAMGDPENFLAATVQMAQLQELSGYTIEALESFRRAEAAAASHPALRADALYGMAKVQMSLHQYQEAIRSLEQALPLRDGAEDRFRRGLLLHNLAAAHWSLAENQRALERYQQALRIRMEIHDQPGLAYTHYGIALTYWTSGQRQMALDAARASLAIWKELDNPFGQANAWNSIGLLYAELGDSAEALDAYSSALLLWLEAKSPLMKAYTLNNRGMLHAGAGRHRQALQDYQAARSVLLASNDERGIAYVLHNLGDLAVMRNNPQEAIGLYEQSLALKRRQRDRFGEAVTLERLAMATAAKGDGANAIILANEALTIHRAVGNRTGELVTVADIARTEQQLGNQPSAHRWYRQALSLAEQSRANIDEEDLRISYFTTLQELYTHYIAFLMKRHQDTGDRSFLYEAFLVNERSRARQMLDAIVSNSMAATGIKSQTDAEEESQWFAEEAKLRAGLRAAAQRLQRLHSAPNPDAPREQARQEFERLHRQWKSLQRREPRGSPLAFVSNRQLPEEPEIDAENWFESLSAHNLPADAALLSFRLGEEDSFVWWFTGGRLSAARLPARKTIERYAGRYLRALTAREVSHHAEDFNGRHLSQQAIHIQNQDDALDHAARQLSWLLLAPALKGLTAWRLVIQPDGLLHQVPFAALPHPYNPEEPMVSTFEISLAPSLGVMAALKSRTPAASPHQETIVVADPVYSPADTRFAVSPAAVHPAPYPALLPRLRFTSREARAVALASPHPVQTFLGFHAQRGVALSAAFRDASLIHLGTHAWVDDRSPAASGLAFSAYSENGLPTDGFLRLFDVYNLRIKADLVVLSGCRTAAGSAIRGEGVNGLVRGFLHAGASHVIASLWSVQDQPTAELMSAFYRNHLTLGQPPARALRNAQLRARRSPHTAHPFYWAAFVVEGLVP